MNDITPNDLMKLEDQNTSINKSKLSAGLCALIEGWETDIKLLQSDIKREEGEMITCEYRREMGKIKSMIKELKEVMEEST